MPGAVLVVTERFDVTADHVVTELAERGCEVVRFDTAEFPGALTMSARLDDGSGSLQVGDRTAQLCNVAAVYYRRPSIHQVHPDLEPADAAWAVREARFGFGGLLASLPVWLNHPADIARAEYKPVQFAAAREAGLRLPPTLLTNDPARAQAFTDAHDPVIYKPLSGIQYRHGAGRDFIYTSRVAPGDLDASVATTACLFQQEVEKDHEVRVIAVDDRCFAARIDAHSARAALDWRSDYDALTYSEVTLPENVRHGIRRLLGALRLRFGALDFVVTPTGEWVWLEINPNGQWAWIDVLTPRIAAAIADALIGAPR